MNKLLKLPLVLVFVVFYVANLNAMEAPKSDDLVACFYACKPTVVKYCSKPVRLGGNVEEIPIQEFCKLHNFNWTDGLELEEVTRNKVWADRKFPKNALTYIENRLHNPLECLVICDMGPVGKGVFLSLDAQSLPVGTIIGLYSGRLMSTLSNTDKVYSMSARDEEHKKSIVHDLISFPSFSAVDKGNILRFIQDLPSIQLDIDKVRNCSELQLKNIATENLAVMAGVHKGFPISFVIVVREILPGEQLGFPYEGEYFVRKNINRALFDIDGNIIGHFMGKNTIKFVDSFEASVEKIVPRIDVYASANILRNMLISPDIDGFDHRKRFIADVTYCLNSFISHRNNNQDMELFLIQLKISFDNAQTSNDKYKILQGAKYPDSLVEMKKELVLHMKKYNEGQLKMRSRK